MNFFSEDFISFFFHNEISFEHTYSETISWNLHLLTGASQSRSEPPDVCISNKSQIIECNLPVSAQTMPELQMWHLHLFILAETNKKNQGKQSVSCCVAINSQHTQHTWRWSRTPPSDSLISNEHIHNIAQVFSATLVTLSRITAQFCRYILATSRLNNIQWFLEPQDPRLNHSTALRCSIFDREGFLDYFSSEISHWICLCICNWSSCT